MILCILWVWFVYIRPRACQWDLMVDHYARVCCICLAGQCYPDLTAGIWSRRVPQYIYQCPCSCLIKYNHYLVVCQCNRPQYVVSVQIYKPISCVCSIFWTFMILHYIAVFIIDTCFMLFLWFKNLNYLPHLAHLSNTNCNLIAFIINSLQIIRLIYWYVGMLIACVMMVTDNIQTI